MSNILHQFLSFFFRGRDSDSPSLLKVERLLDEAIAQLERKEKEEIWEKKNKNKTRLKAEALYSAHRRHQNIYTAQTLFFRMTSRCDMRAAFIAAETGGRLDLCIISRLVLHFLSANTDTARAYRRRLILLSPF